MTESIFTSLTQAPYIVGLIVLSGSPLMPKPFSHTRAFCPWFNIAMVWPTLLEACPGPAFFPRTAEGAQSGSSTSAMAAAVYSAVRKPCKELVAAE